MSRSQTAWSTTTKNSDAWVSATRNSTIWNNEAGFPDSYIYSNATLTYNSSSRPYNYISAVPADQVNNRNPTAWAGSSRNADIWSNEPSSQFGYSFDSTQTYDSSYTYDFTTFVANQSNNKNTGAWVVVV